jgi:predicted peptidase
VLFLHGVGERGDDLDLVETHGLPKVIKSGERFPFITVAPQCPNQEWWSRAEMVKCLVYLVKKITKMYNVDSRRVYVTGLSMGGYGTIALANERADLFAAALPVCGGADFSDYSNLKSLPIWFFHGSEDDEHPASFSEKIYYALKDQNKDVKLTIYDGVGHNSWDLTYDNQEIYDWLLSKENSGENDKH